MNAICFISNTRATLEARIFAKAISRLSELMDYRLVTTCATSVEMAVFKTWIQRERPVDLVLPPDSHEDEWDESKRKIVELVKLARGRLIRTVSSAEYDDPRIPKMVHLSDFSVVMELSADHWVFNWSHQLFSRQKTAVFQLPYRTGDNEGNYRLADMGRGVPVYMGSWRQQLRAFLAGSYDDEASGPRQLTLI